MAQHGRFGNVVVDPIYIGVGVVDDVVLLFPDEGIGAQAIHGKPHDVIEGFVVGITSMTGIVHNVEANAGPEKAHD